MRTCAISPRFSRTTPASILCRISGESTLSATGNPSRSATATASSAEFNRRSRALATPQAASRCLLSDSVADAGFGEVQAALWAMIQIMRVDEKLSGMGRLLEEMPPM